MLLGLGYHRAGGWLRRRGLADLGPAGFTWRCGSPLAAALDVVENPLVLRLLTIAAKHATADASTLAGHIPAVVPAAADLAATGTRSSSSRWRSATCRGWASSWCADSPPSAEQVHDPA